MPQHSQDTTSLGTKPVGKLLVQYAMPAIIAMTASSLYNIVDSIFIGHGCGPLALSGLTVAKPFMDICAAFGSLVGVGAGTLVAIKFGERDYQSARRVLGNVIVLNILLSILVSGVGLVFLDPILYAFGASEQTLVYAHDYMFPILIGNVLTHIYFGLNNVLRSSGHPMVAMTATIVAVSVNIILDPIFIFWLDMGVSGAAIATMISQTVAVVGQLFIFCNPKQTIHFSKDIWRLNGKIVERSLSIGLSPFLMNIAHCFVVIILNNQLKRYGGDMAIASYGVINRFTFVFAMIVMGLNQGMQPIVGFNYGAKQYHRMLRAFRLTAYAATMVLMVLFAMAEIFPRQIIHIFTNDVVLIEDSILPMRIACCAMWLVGFQMVTGNFFTSIGMASKAICLSLIRQVILLIPLSLIMPLVFVQEPIMGVWWCMPTSDTLAAITAAIMLHFQMKMFRRKIEEQEQWLTTIPPQPD